MWYKTIGRSRVRNIEKQDYGKTGCRHNRCLAREFEKSEEMRTPERKSKNGMTSANRNKVPGLGKEHAHKMSRGQTTKKKGAVKE